MGKDHSNMHSAKECIPQTQNISLVACIYVLHTNCNQWVLAKLCVSTNHTKKSYTREDKKVKDIDFICLSDTNFIKITIFWELMPRSLVHRYQYFQGISSLHLHTYILWMKAHFLWNVGTYLPDYTEDHGLNSHHWENLNFVKMFQ